MPVADYGPLVAAVARHGTERPALEATDRDLGPVARPLLMRLGCKSPRNFDGVVENP
jgi:hypothetical protein